MPDLHDLRYTIPEVGTITWLGIRPARRAPVKAVTEITIDLEQSILGDHFSGKASSDRQVTLIQKEHIDAVASILGKTIGAELLRRNIVVMGINLQSLKEQNFEIGSAVLCGTGNCHPCSRMEENLGVGGYSAMRGHGGITAKVVEAGTVKVGDRVMVIPADVKPGVEI